MAMSLRVSAQGADRRMLSIMQPVLASMLPSLGLVLWVLVGLDERGVSGTRFERGKSN